MICLLFFLQRPRTAIGGKLSVPKPVNLPSIKKVCFRGSFFHVIITVAYRMWKLVCIRLQEHAGNDPSTQLVPSGTGSGSWSKPEDSAPSSQPEIGAVRQSSITAGSSWAAGGTGSAVGAWQPSDSSAPQPQPVVRGPSSYPDRPQRDRPLNLNPEEYPSLADAKINPQSALSQKPGYKLGYEQQVTFKLSGGN
jgi:hypothetical protein